MANQPDFIVDPSGKVQDVRHQKYSRWSGAPPPQKPGTGYSQYGGGQRSSPRSPQASGNPPYVLVIPIGLILTILVYVCKLFIAPTANFDTPRANSNVPRVSSNTPRANVGFADSNYSSDLSSGYYAFLKGEYDRAIVHFGIAIHSNPDFGEAYNGRGLVYWAKGDYDAAIADLDKAIGLLGDRSPAYSNRGIVYSAMGEYDRAIADFDRAIQLKPDFGKAYHNRGLVYYAEGNYDAAIANFDKAIQFTSETTSAILNNPPSGDGTNMAVSLTDYMKLFQFEADLPLAYTGRGVAYLSKDQYDRAITDLEKALELGLDPSVAQQVKALLTILTSTAEPGYWEGKLDQGGYLEPISFDIGTDTPVKPTTLSVEPDGSVPKSKNSGRN